MKKFAKLSLVAAIAVAGATSASAVDLTEAIKGVDISGNITYEYKDKKIEKTGGASVDRNVQENEYDAELTAKIPVNDIVTAVAKFDVTGNTSDDGNNEIESTVAGDAKPGVTLEDVYFSFALPYATINAGKQNIPGPFTDGAQGTGIVALVPVGPVTLAGGYFVNHSVGGQAVKAADAFELAALASLGPVNAEFWYADVSNVLDAYNIKAAATFGTVKVIRKKNKKKEKNKTSKQTKRKT
eukprot:TRINITY_DN1079_c0_g1_i3.p1 TRINITY_DN1079_c0_g1~~TRINITY_DN1079_c0_g1_i3.p1  ORF type:complete len:241 (+),score=78.86 TRINITY_DN1079_c0_g1_i3:98-820(+)